MSFTWPRSPPLCMYLVVLPLSPIGGSVDEAAELPATRQGERRQTNVEHSRISQADKATQKDSRKE